MRKKNTLEREREREREQFGSSYWILFTIAHRCLNIGPVVPEINRPPTLPSLY
jgi:hypothetical protein